MCNVTLKFLVYHLGTPCGLPDLKSDKDRGLSEKKRTPEFKHLRSCLSILSFFLFENLKLHNAGSTCKLICKDSGSWYHNGSMKS